MGGNVEDATYLAFCHQTLLKFSKQNKNEKGNNTESSCTTIHPHSNQKEEKWKGYLFIYLKKRQTKLGIQLSKFMPIVLKSLLGIKG